MKKTHPIWEKMNKQIANGQVPMLTRREMKKYKKTLPDKVRDFYKEHPEPLYYRGLPICVTGIWDGMETIGKPKTAIRSGITPINYKLPTFKLSFDNPIEEEIIEFCKNMVQQMERVANKPNNGLFGTSFMDTDKKIREGASNYAKAYRTVEKHIRQEIELRKKIKK